MVTKKKSVIETSKKLCLIWPILADEDVPPKDRILSVRTLRLHIEWEACKGKESDE